MASNGMARRYWVLTMYLAICSAWSLVMLFLWAHQTTYRRVFSAVSPFIMLAECAAVISLFWVLVENYKSFRKIGAIGISGLVGLGVIVAWATRGVGIPLLVGARETMLLWQRYESLVLVGLLAGIYLLLPRSKYLPLRGSAQRAVAVFSIEATEGLLLGGIGVFLNGGLAHAALWIRWAVTLFPLALRMVTGSLWMFWLTPASDADPQVMVMSEEEIARQKRDAAMRMRLLIAELRDSFRHLDEHP